MENVTRWQVMPKREARFAPYPEGVDARIPAALEKHGVHKLYTHQAQAFAAAKRWEK